MSPTNQQTMHRMYVLRIDKWCTKSGFGFESNITTNRQALASILSYFFANTVYGTLTVTYICNGKGTIHSVCEEIRQNRGECLPIRCDVRFEAETALGTPLVDAQYVHTVHRLLIRWGHKIVVKQTLEVYGGIDVVIYNAGLSL